VPACCRTRRKGEEKMGMRLREVMDWVLGIMVLGRSERGQGTTEYAILVGVLVVIAVLSIIAFRGKIQELWDAIADGIGSL